MRRTVFVSAVMLGFSTAAAAQKQRSGIQLNDVAGVWDASTLMGPTDSVVATTVLTATADGKGWTMTFSDREPVAVRVVSMGGDSVVTETGPYASILRAGQKVTLLRMIAHYTGDNMSGSFTAQYESGDTITGKVTATRRK